MLVNKGSLTRQKQDCLIRMMRIVGNVVLLRIVVFHKLS